MILQSLVKYYERLKNDPDVNIPEFGYSKEKISFSLVLNKDGDLLQVKDLRENPAKGKAKPVLLSVPKLKGRSGKNPPPYFLWDNVKYVLGVEKNSQKNVEAPFLTTADRLESFKVLIEEYDIEDAGYKAVKRFLMQWSPDKANNLVNLEDVLHDTGNLVFELDSEIGYIHNRLAVKAVWEDVIAKSMEDEIPKVCLISGENTIVAETHPLIKGVYGAQAAGAAIASFNKDAFTSFQKKQNINSPVGISSAFSYTTALNYLLDKENGQRLQVADASTVFWAERKTPMESFLGFALDAKDDGSSEELKSYLTALSQGVLPNELEDDSQFYVLGLAPNAARISVRFWHCDTVSAMANKLGQHFTDMNIVQPKQEVYTPASLWRILLETATLRKTENIPPLLGGAVLRTILDGLPYPEALLSKLIVRIRADQDINPVRAGLLKAFLNRKKRFNKTHIIEKEITMALDEKNQDQAYLLGRLFSVLEKAQQDAIPGANATIKDRYFGAASATPKVVFPILIKGAQNHFQKVKPKFYTEKLVGEILEGIQSFPTHLSLDEQGLFAIGYYHQRQHFFTKTPTETTGA
jgi:CRISPR-associated protein Csd1